jgi:hypothetical protein
MLTNNAITKFPNEQRVIDFVLEKYDYGDFVSMKK